MNSQNENEARAVERAEPVAWVEYAENGNARMWSGKLETWEVLSDFDNRHKNPKPLYSQETIDRLTGEVEREKERADKFMWQVRDTCARAESAERRAAELVESARAFLAASDAYDSAEMSSQYPDNQGLLRAYRWARKELEETLTQPEADHG